MEKIIKMNFFVESIMPSCMFIMMDMISKSFFVPLLLALNSSFPDSIEDKFTFSNADLSTLNQIAFFFVLRLDTLNLRRIMIFGVTLPKTVFG